jgi:ligand-binding sensor domain-containing protein
MKQLLVGWLLAIALVPPVPGQHPFFYRLDEADGLPAMEAYFMHQDSRGYLWLGTAAGLCRYDGYECVPYPAQYARNRGANLILEDPQGRIWFSNFAGQLFFVRNDSVHLLQAWERIPHAYFSLILSPPTAVCGSA